MTCETCGYIPWPGERGCASCQEIEDKKWAAAAPEAPMKITHLVKECDRIGTVRFSDGRVCQYLDRRDEPWGEVDVWFCDFGSNRKVRFNDKRRLLVERKLNGWD